LTATSLFPSADEATEAHHQFSAVTWFVTQVAPESAEVKTDVELSEAITNLFPSADEAMSGAKILGVLALLFDAQVKPALVEQKIPPTAPATSLLPSADETIPIQFSPGAPVCIHVWANAKLAVNKTVKTTSRILKFFIGCLNEPSSFNHFMEPLSSQPFSYGLSVSFV